MGPLLLARLLSLNDVQSGVLHVVFKYCDDNGLLLIDLKDLRAAVAYVGNNAASFKASYGNVSLASIGAIQRGLLVLEEQGGGDFFGEPAVQVTDFVRTSPTGRGVVNILAADKLFQRPMLYSTFMLWLLSEVYENLPEVGDLDKPRLVFFFDEAHLLFKDASPNLLDKIEQVIRLIRSKGVGIFFITQNPADIPETVLAQLGNRFMHALRAFTPNEQRGIQAAADSFRQNPGLDIRTAITELEVGEALVSCLDEKGAPSLTERAFIVPPSSRIGAIDQLSRQSIINASNMNLRYNNGVDAPSAYERLKDLPSPTAQETKSQAKQPKSQSQELIDAALKSAARSIGTRVGGQILRGVLGGIFGKR